MRRMASFSVEDNVQPGDVLLLGEGIHARSGLQRLALHLRNVRLIGVDTVILAPLLPVLGFFLLHGTQNIPWLTVAGLVPVGWLLTAAIFGLNNVADAEIDAHDPLKQANGVNPIALGQMTQREALIPILGCGLLGLAFAARLSIFPWALLALAIGALYSVPPVRLKERAGMDLLAHSLVSLSALLMGMAAAQANHPLRAAVAVAWVVLISAKGETTNLIRDYESDRAQGIGTTAVRLGVGAVSRMRLGLLLAAVGLLLFAGWQGAFSLVAALLMATIMALEILALLRPGYYMPAQRMLFVLNYAAAGAVFVLLSV
jgi:4-hydroxybenzoate polyprenyltransferase